MNAKVLLPMVSIFLMAGSAGATLGENAASVERNRAAANGPSKTPSTTIKTTPAYKVQEMNISGETVREYLTKSGTVFAVAWNGMGQPDLKTLLGSYNDEYQGALKKQMKVPGRRHSSLKSEHLVVEKWGHMRDLHGRAYSPALLPAGVDPNEIQ